MTASGNRQATVERRTGETEVELSLDLGGGEVSAATGIGFLDHMLDLLGRHGRLGLAVRAALDRQVQRQPRPVRDRAEELLGELVVEAARGPGR